MPAQPDLIVWGSRIRTLDPGLPFCSAVAVKEGMVVATGDDDTIRAMRGPGTAVIDGRGIAFVPGLTDSHIHPLWGSIATQGADLFTARTVADLRERLALERQRDKRRRLVARLGTALRTVRGDRHPGRPLRRRRRRQADAASLLRRTHHAGEPGRPGPGGHSRPGRVRGGGGGRLRRRRSHRRAARVSRHAPGAGRHPGGGRRHPIPLVPRVVPPLQRRRPDVAARDGRLTRWSRRLSPPRRERRSHLPRRHPSLATAGDDLRRNARSTPLPRRARDGSGAAARPSSSSTA